MQLSQRVARLAPSAVRELLKTIHQPGVISFAGGLPSPESFPEITASPQHRDALQYGASEGETELREHIAEHLCSNGLPVRADQVLILSGSQQGIDLVAKLVVDQGSCVAVEAPTYLAALQVFSLFGAHYATYTADDLSALNGGSSPRLIYTIPTFQNPTGYCYTQAQRQSLAAQADSLGCVLFEDDPYRDLVFSECERRPVCAYIKKAPWIYQSSFSKTLAPGLRLGYLACSPELYPTLVWLKQAADLHSNRLSQSLVMHMLTTNSERLPQVVGHYKTKRDQFHELLEQTMAPYANWSVPAGGLFFWLKLRAELGIDVDVLLQEALKSKVAFMPGTPFFTRPPGESCLRLNFSHASVEQMERGLNVLGALVEGKAHGSVRASNWSA